MLRRSEAPLGPCPIDGDIRLDFEDESPMRFAQARFDRVRRCCLRENEAQVAGTLRRWSNDLTPARGDLYIGDAEDLPRAFEVVRTLENAAFGNRDHHHAAGLVVARLRQWLLQGVAQDQFL